MAALLPVSRCGSGSGRERTEKSSTKKGSWSLLTDGIRSSNQRISDSCFFPTNMGNEHSQPNVKLPKIKFRVLIIGRANAGKTSILQRVCDTTDSPVIYRRMGDGKKKEKVRGQRFCNRASWFSLSPQIQLEPSMDVSDTRSYFGASFLIVELARRTHYRGWTCICQS